MRLTLLFCCFLTASASAVEGMFPVNDLARLDLEAAGLSVTAADIFAPDGSSLVDAICKVNGCTGSFVSGEGLILTNQHCAFGAIQQAGKDGRDYLTEGFVARDRAGEFPASGFTVRITEGWRDVSAEVLEVVVADLDPLARTRAIERRIKELELQAERDNPGLRAEIAEMFRGRTYLLFLYTYLKDVRLVYAPSRDVGNFGGEEDNWVWPRHTGDFSFMRAYTAPDGSPAEYHRDNVPYRPRVHLPVATDGVGEGDPVFVLGYPGRTYRHRSAAFMRHEARVRMPWIVDWFGWQIRLMEANGDGRLASRLKSLHNTHKNYRGKLQGIERLDLVAVREAADAGLAAWIDADPGRRECYGDILPALDAFYEELNAARPAEYWLRFIFKSPAYLRLALSVHEAARERGKPDLERETAYMDRNFDQTLAGLVVGAERLVPEVERAILAEALRRGGALPPAAVPEPLRDLVGDGQVENAAAMLDDALARTNLADPQWVRSAAQLDSEQQVRLDDPFLELAARLYPAWERQREDGRRRRGRLDPLLAALVDARQERMGEDFVPDANGTLRLSWGTVEGYRPRDGVFFEPVTTVAGLLEKDTGRPPYRLPAKLRDRARDGCSSVPVCLLYSTDTVGGNSGSPLLDARGRIAALNFDRPWEATINDYAWDRAWSRSIGVDIRYVLWVAGAVDGAEHLLREMGVRP